MTEATRPYVVALDQGTTSCRAIVFDRRGAVVAAAKREFTQHFPEPGWVEHDPMEIWRVQLDVLRQAVSSIAPGDIAAIGITNQRETTMIWDAETGEPLHNAIVWQCRRTQPVCEQLRSRGLAPSLQAKTGLVLDPYFSGSKLKWLLDLYPDARGRGERGELLFGTMDSWLLWQLTGGKVHATDATNASRTMLYNIHTLSWDEDILRELDIPPAMLPEVKPSSGLFGYTTVLGEGNPIPISGVAGDQQAALFGQRCFREGMAKNTYGTGCFILANTGNRPVPSKDGLLTTIAWQLDGQVQYALEGSVFIAGAAIQWLRDMVGLIADSAESEKLAFSLSDTEGVYFVPAFVGLGAPHWQPEARGMITGLTRSSGKAHIVRAALEAIAYQSWEVLSYMQKQSGVALSELRADGGASHNRFLMQFQADLLGVPVTRPDQVETTALGAAYLAGLGVGYWGSLTEIEQLASNEIRFLPERDEAYRKEKCAGWRKAVAYQLH